MKEIRGGLQVSKLENADSGHQGLVLKPDTLNFDQ